AWHHARQPQPVVAGSGKRDDAEQGAGGAAALTLTPRRPSDLGVHGASFAREAIDDARAHGGDASHAAGIELVGGVARLVVAAVSAGIEEQHRDPRCVDPAVIGGPVGRAVDLERDALELCRVARDRADPAPAVGAADVQTTSLQPAD